MLSRLRINKKNVVPPILDLNDLQRKWRQCFQFKLSNNRLSIKLFSMEDNPNMSLLPKFIKELTQRIKVYHIKEVQNLHLDLSEGHLLDLNGLVSICHHLFPNLKGLRKLSICFSISLNVPDGAINKFCHRICHYFRNLKHLSFKVLRNYRVPIQDAEILRLMYVLGKKLNRLTNFELLLPRMKEDMALKISPLIGRNMTTLQRLSVAFPNLALTTNKSLQRFSKTIVERSRNLKQLNLDFSILEGNPVIIRQGIDCLCTAIEQRFAQLQELTLQFAGCDEITDEKCSHLASNLMHKLTSLEKLNISFGRCRQITGMGFNYLGVVISIYLQRLKEFSLDLHRCVNLTEEGIAQLASSFNMKIPNLQKLSLNLAYCDEITGEGIKKLSKMFNPNLSSLQALSLDFSWCGNITNEALVHLGVSIGKNLPKLQDLSLVFADAKPKASSVKFLGITIKTKKISNKGLSRFCLVLAHSLVKLQKISLKFENYAKISDQGVRSVINSFDQNLPTLHHINLNFRMCSKVTPKSKEYAQTKLKSVKKLEFHLI